MTPCVSFTSTLKKQNINSRNENSLRHRKCPCVSFPSTPKKKIYKHKKCISLRHRLSPCLSFTSTPKRQITNNRNENSLRHRMCSCVSFTSISQKNPQKKTTRQNKNKKNMRNKINPTAVTGKPINLRETCLNSEARVKDCYACIHYWCHMQSFSLPIMQTLSMIEARMPWHPGLWNVPYLANGLSPMDHDRKKTIMQKNLFPQQTKEHPPSQLPCRGVLRTFVRSWPPSWKAKAWKDAWNFVKQSAQIAWRWY